MRQTAAGSEGGGVGATLGDEAKKQKEAAPWVVMLWSLPVTAFGALMGWLGYSSIQQSQQMQRWVQLPATILEASLETHHSSDSGNVTYCVRARYQYFYQGKWYTSTRVGIDAGSDNMDSYHHDLAARLQEAKSFQSKFPCYVNPANPADAVLDRSVRTSLLVFKGIFFVIFGGLGVAGFISGFCRFLRGLGRSAGAAAQAGEE